MISQLTSRRVDKAEKKWSITPQHHELHPVMEAFFKHNFDLVVELVNTRLQRGFVEQANALRIMKALALVYLGREKEVVDTMCGVWIPYQRKSLLQGDRFYTVAPQLRGVLPRRFLYLLDAAIMAVATLPGSEDYDPKLDCHGPGYWRPTSSVPLRPVPKRVRRRLRRTNRKKKQSAKALLAAAHPWSFWGALPYDVPGVDGLSPHFVAPRQPPVADHHFAGPEPPFWYTPDNRSEAFEVSYARQRAYDRIVERRRTILAPAKAAVARAKYLSGRARGALDQRNDQLVGVPRVGKLLAMPWLDGGVSSPFASSSAPPVAPGDWYGGDGVVSSSEDEDEDEDDYDSEVDDVYNPAFGVAWDAASSGLVSVGLGDTSSYDDDDDDDSVSGYGYNYQFRAPAKFSDEFGGTDTEAESVDDRRVA